MGGVTLCYVFASANRQYVNVILGDKVEMCQAGEKCTRVKVYLCGVFLCNNSTTLSIIPMGLSSFGPPELFRVSLSSNLGGPLVA